MITANKKNIYRWVLLRHIYAPDDLRGIHFDLLLEDQDLCRSWRLSEVPCVDGSYVEAACINPHKLDWLEIKEKAVSGNRGYATRIKKGIFFSSLPTIQSNLINLSMIWDDIEVTMLIDENGCRITKQKK